jgi:hypothetical protein
MKKMLQKGKPLMDTLPSEKEVLALLAARQNEIGVLRKLLRQIQRKAPPRQPVVAKLTVATK